MNDETLEITPLKYELMFILPTTLTEDKRLEVIKELEELIASKKGEIIHRDDWGKRHLSYRIAKNDEGYYLIYYFTLNSGADVREIDEHLRLDQDILRHMIIRRDEDYQIVDYKKLEELERAEKEAAKTRRVNVSEKGIDQVVKAKRAPTKELSFDDEPVKPYSKKVEDVKPEEPVAAKVEDKIIEPDDLDKKLADIISDADINL
jgi:small subunit ribosomal protein S6